MHNTLFAIIFVALIGIMGWIGVKEYQSNQLREELKDKTVVRVDEEFTPSNYIRRCHLYESGRYECEIISRKSR